MSDVDDRIAVAKFGLLVEKCNNKEEILDLCEKALAKYRPPKKKDPIDWMAAQKDPRDLPVTVRDLTKVSTYKLRAKMDVDQLMLGQMLATEYEGMVKSDIIKRISGELARNDLIKYEVHSNQAQMSKTFIGTLEIVVP